ncbi:MAG: TadE family protein [Bryobacteraceae bacterium]
MRRESGQSTLEFALIYGAVLMPLTFMIVFAAELLWVWHGVVEFTREGAQYAATHCWQAGADNVLNYMRSRVPLMIDREQFLSGPAEIVVEYYARDPETGALVEFSCDGGDCSTACVPDLVTVRVRNYEFRKFSGFLGLPPIPLPDFRMTLPMESAGCVAGEQEVSCMP